MPPQDFKLILMHFLEHKDLEVSKLIVQRGQFFTCIFDGFHEHRTAFNTQFCVFCSDTKRSSKVAALHRYQNRTWMDRMGNVWAVSSGDRYECCPCRMYEKPLYLVPSALSRIKTIHSKPGPQWGSSTPTRHKDRELPTSWAVCDVSCV